MRTKRMVIEQYGEDMAIRGYRVMAFVTALGGISLDDSVNVIEKDMEYIWNYFAESQSRVELFFNFISESSEKDSISAIKPNLIGELIFLYEWGDLNKNSKANWIYALKNNIDALAFLSRCIVDWSTESISLCETLLDIVNNPKSVDVVTFIIKIFSMAVQEAPTEHLKMKYLNIISEINIDSIFSMSIDKSRLISLHNEIACVLRTSNRYRELAIEHYQKILILQEKGEDKIDA